jgi:hypothetical protein
VDYNHRISDDEILKVQYNHIQLVSRKGSHRHRCLSIPFFFFNVDAASGVR